MEDNEIQKAYETLELPQGASWNAIDDQFKFLVMAYHPDRAKERHKEKANAKLKKVNHAFDVLEAHFKSSEHSESADCRCRRQNVRSEKSPAQDFSQSKANASASNAESSTENAPPYAHSTQTSRSSNDYYGAPSSPSSADRRKSEKQTESISFPKLTGKQKTIALTAISILLVWGHFDHLKDDEIARKEKAEQAAREKADYDSRPQWQPGDEEAAARQAQELADGQRARQAANLEYEQKLARAREEVDRYEKSLTRNQENIAELSRVLAQGNLAFQDKKNRTAELDLRQRDLAANQISLESARAALAEIEKTAPPKAQP